MASLLHEPTLGAKLASSLFGYISTSASIASLIPLIAANWATKTNMVTPMCAYSWLIADTLILISTFLMRPQFVIYVISIWCFLADLIVFVQLQLYGSHAWGAKRVLKGEIMYERFSVMLSSPRSQRWHQRMKSWDTWDICMVFTVCILGGLMGWSVMELLSARGAWSEPENNSSPVIIITGAIGMCILDGSRLFELYNGMFVLVPMYKKDSVNGRVSQLTEEEQIDIDAPGITGTSLLFWFALVASAAEIICILTYSTEWSYLKPMMPTLLGSIVGVITDLVLLLLAGLHWWPLWRNTRTYRTHLDSEEGKAEALLKAKLARQITVLEMERMGDNAVMYERWYKPMMNGLVQEREAAVREGKRKRVAELDKNIRREREVYTDLIRRFRWNRGLD